VVLTQVPVGTSWIGEPVKALEASAGTRVAYIDRLGAPIVPQSGTVLQEGDVVHVIALESDIDQIAFAFSARERGAH
jgi:trk system potassium uptake protein TrkA